MGDFIRALSETKTVIALIAYIITGLLVYLFVADIEIPQELWALVAAGGSYFLGLKTPEGALFGNGRPQIVTNSHGDTKRVDTNH